MGRLGQPVGVAVYRPLNSTGEDFLPEYLGEAGLPVEMVPQFPQQAKTVLLTAAAAHDPQIVEKIEAHLMAGGHVAITTGLLQKLQPQLAQICDLRIPGQQLLPTEYWGGYGAGSGAGLGISAPLMMPEVDFFTNDAWPLVRGTAGGRGALYVLTIPDNFNDLYRLPAGVLTALRSYLGEDLPVTMEGPSQVALMEYDNGTFVVESYRDQPVTVTLRVKGTARELHNLATGAAVQADPEPDTAKATQHGAGTPGAQQRTSFTVTVLPHSYMAFAIAGAGSTAE